MNIDDLIEDYKRQTKICSEIDYSDKNSVKKNNKAVNRMYQIVELISESNKQSEIEEFSKLLNDQENRTNLWSAVHLLEKLNFDKKTEKEALKIIEKAAKGNTSEAIGFQYWLKEYKSE